MGRRRVLVLAPAITRIQCMSNPYKRIEGGGGDAVSGAHSKSPVSERGAVVQAAATTSTSFWSSWRKKRAAKKTKRAGGSDSGSGGATGARRVRGFRVTKLRIRMLSPLFWLKKLRDSYVNMMLAIERSAPRECTTGMVTYPKYMYQAQGGGGAWVFPALPPPIVF